MLNKNVFRWLAGAMGVVLLATPGIATTQQRSATNLKCSSGSPVGFLGISGLICANCYISRAGEGHTSLFATEPRISNIAPKSPAASVLRVGDVLVSVDNRLITTTAGGVRLSNLKPGQDVVIEVRRRGELRRHRFANLPAICPTDARVLGARARSNLLASRRADAREVTPRVAMDTTRRAAPLPRASFGFSISCAACDMRVNEDGTIFWQFREPPEIYQVDTQGPAFRAGIRRGDVLTRIDGVDILSAEGERRFGQVRPGQLVAFTTRRGSTTRTRSLRAQARGTPEAAALAAAEGVASDTSLRQLRRMIEELRRQETREHTQIEELRERQGRELQALTQRLMRQHQEQQSRLESMHAELVRAERSALAQQELTHAALFPTRARERNTFRYAGRLGDTDIEVRGPAGVVVNETPDSIIITTFDSTIRLKKSDRR